MTDRIVSFLMLATARAMTMALTAAATDTSSTNAVPVPLHGVGDSLADNRHVHQWIANEAHTYFTNEVEGADLSAWLGTLAGSFEDHDNNLLEGVRDEDQAGENPAAPGSTYSLLPYTEHFCAGADGSELDDGLLSYPAAVTRAVWYWDNYAKPNYPANRAASFYYLGHVAHLVADMTVPAHVHNDDHIFSEPYEDAIAANGWFHLWYYGCTSNDLAVAWLQPLSVDYADLRALIQRTANYTEDYDSRDSSGDVSLGAAPFDPGDYLGTWHRPAEVSRFGGMRSEELTITADDLMPYAIRRVADLYRLFYRQVDATPPDVAMLYPESGDPSHPTVRGTLAPLALAAAAADSQSGIVRRGYRFAWRRQEAAGDWTEWQMIATSPTPPSAVFTPTTDAGLYAFRVLAENGGGAVATSAVTYMRIVLPIPEAPLLHIAVACPRLYVVSWDSSSGHLYSVDHSASLVSQTLSRWSISASNLPATPPLNTFTDRVADAPVRFYRVRADLMDR
ncbi:MAG: hypothetical protein PHR35_03865 [Kiritimatiellae bacterium]|nr:hypothetical protein [Kiritimatiellia bacterium]